MPTTVGKIDQEVRERQEYIKKVKSVLLGIFQRNPALLFTQDELREALVKAPEVRRFPWFLCFLNWLFFNPHSFYRTLDVSDALGELIEEGKVVEWRESRYGRKTLGEARYESDAFDHMPTQEVQG
ncbi:MAG: hypothetical protein Q8P03_00050 [bacterium]|nr:hypothetical protein [bacterium]